MGAFDHSESDESARERRIGIVELERARELASPAPMPEPPDPNEIHVALKPGEKPYFWVNQFQVFMVIGLVGLGLNVAWLALWKLANFVNPSLLAGINSKRAGLLVGLGIVVVAIVVFIAIVLRRNAKAAVPETIPRTTNLAFRLRMMGKEAHSTAIVNALTPDANFEPVIIRLWFGHARESVEVNKLGHPKFFDQGGVSARIWWIAGAITVGGLVLASWTTGWSLIKFDMWTMWAGMGLVTLIATWIKPSYLRIAPGQLDVMEFGPMGVGRVRCSTYDLRRVKIAINLPVGVARIEDCSEARMPTLHIRPAMIVNPSSKWLAHGADHVWVALLDGARTSVPTPPLPEDELVG